jgi:hypothetical protein
MKGIVLATALLAAGVKNHANLERPASEADLLRAYGFAACLSKAYGKTPMGEDAARVADGYRQLGALDIEPYTEVRKAAEAIDAAKPTTAGNHNFAIMACLEFYESAKLKKLATAAAKPSGKK